MIDQAKRVQGKVALISGAAQGVSGKVMGFGGASARLLAEHGASVMLGDIDVDNGEKTAAEIREMGGKAEFIKLDVTLERDWIEAVNKTIVNFGRLDILVSSAGTTAPGSVDGTTVEMWNSQMDMHGKGCMLGIKHVVPQMRKNNSCLLYRSDAADE